MLRTVTVIKNIVTVPATPPTGLPYVPPLVRSWQVSNNDSPSDGTLLQAQGAIEGYCDRRFTQQTYQITFQTFDRHAVVYEGLEWPIRSVSSGSTDGVKLLPPSDGWEVYPAINAVTYTAGYAPPTANNHFESQEARDALTTKQGEVALTQSQLAALGSVTGAQDLLTEILAEIAAATAAGQDTSALELQRDATEDRLAEIAALQAQLADQETEVLQLQVQYDAAYGEVLTTALGAAISMTAKNILDQTLMPFGATRIREMSSSHGEYSPLLISSLDPDMFGGQPAGEVTFARRRMIPNEVLGLIDPYRRIAPSPSAPLQWQ